MIAELVEQANLMSLTGSEPFRQGSVHWLIDLDEYGNFLGFAATAGATISRKGVLNERRGKRYSIPANYLLGSPNQHNWRPDFLTGPADEIFPRGVDGTNPAPQKRKAFWKLVFAARSTLPDNNVLRAIWCFLRSTRSLCCLPIPRIAKENLDWFRKSPNADGETISFRVAGILACDDKELRKWWAEVKHPAFRKHETDRFSFQEIGEDAFQQGSGLITASSPCVFGNVPLVSFNNATFCSFGLGDQTARMRLDTVEKAAAALNLLRQTNCNRCNLGDEKAIFWAVHKGNVLDCSFISLIEANDPLAVADYLNSVWGSVPRELDHASFHVAILLEGTGRFAVRSWNSGHLGEVDQRLRTYFSTIRLPTGAPVNLGAMARSTIQKTKKGSKTTPSNLTYNAIFESAWRGVPLPFRLLESIIARQRIEISKGQTEDDKGDFQSRLRARTALIKLYFKTNKDITMNEHTHKNQDHPAYLCGRVLAQLDRIHNEAHGKSTASSPADRYYGSASSSPALVFPRLCKLARIHLAAVRKDPKRGWLAPNLDKDLTVLIANFRDAATWPRTLSLEDQGRFAIGFYYQRAPKCDEPTSDDNQTNNDSTQLNPES